MLLQPNLLSLSVKCWTMSLAQLIKQLMHCGEDIELYHIGIA